MFTLKLSLRDEQNFSNKNVQINNKSSNKVDNESVFHNCSLQGPCFKEISNDLKDNIINIFDELKNVSTLKDGFKEPRNKDFVDSNSESIIDFNVDPQFNRLTCEINDSNNFDSVKQMVKVIKLYLIATKGKITTIITTIVNKAIMLIYLWVTVV